MTRTKYGALTAQHQVGELPKMNAMPSQLRVVEHRVGYSEIVLENGDHIRLHLFVEEMSWVPEQATYAPVYRVVPEVLKRGWGGCEAFPREALS
jgi:hypothetical protein